MKINGERHYLSRAIDHEGEVLEAFRASKGDLFERLWISDPSDRKLFKMPKKREDNFWSLPQASVRVRFGSNRIVAQFADCSVQEWMAFQLYGLDDVEHEEVGSSRELFDALEDGRLIAFGRRANGGSAMEEIPAVELHDLIPDEASPYLRSPSGAKVLPWLSICIRRADVERLWRSSTETEARSKFDWKSIRKIFYEVRELNPKFSKNELIQEAQLQFQKSTKREPPSRSSFQRHMKDW